MPPLLKILTFKCKARKHIYHISKSHPLPALRNIKRNLLILDRRQRLLLLDFPFLDQLLLLFGNFLQQDTGRFVIRILCD